MFRVKFAIFSQSVPVVQSLSSDLLSCLLNLNTIQSSWIILKDTLYKDWKFTSENIKISLSTLYSLKESNWLSVFVERNVNLFVWHFSLCRTKCQSSRLTWRVTLKMFDFFTLKNLESIHREIMPLGKILTYIWHSVRRWHLPQWRDLDELAFRHR